MIVVTTHTGRIGHQVLDNVLGSAEAIRVIARDPSHLSPRVRERVEVMQGSHDDIAVVTRAFADADCVFWLVPTTRHADSVEGHYLDFTRPACEAIKSQGVKRVVGVSTLGCGLAGNAGQLSAALAMDELLESTDVSYRALHKPFFLENLLNQVESIKSQGLFFLANSGDRPLPTLATCDIAAVAAKLLLDNSWRGLDDQSPNDMAQVISEVLELPVRFQQITSSAYTAMLMQHGMTEAAAQDQGIYSTKPRAAQSITNFRQWCEDVLGPADLA